MVKRSAGLNPNKQCTDIVKLKWKVKNKVKFKEKVKKKDTHKFEGKKLKIKRSLSKGLVKKKESLKKK